MAIIASILGILVFLLAEVAPLLLGARVSSGRELDLPGGASVAVVADAYQTHVAALGTDARVRILEAKTGRVARDLPLGEDFEEPLRVGSAPGQQLLTAATADGRVLGQRVRWPVDFDGDQRRVSAELPAPIVFEMDPRGRPVGAFSVRVDDEGRAAAAAQLDDGGLVVVRRRVTENLFTGETSESRERHELEAPGPLTVLLLDQDARTLYGGGAQGELAWWELRGEDRADPRWASRSGAGVTALSLLIGDRSLVVGRSDGSIEVRFQVRKNEKTSLPLVREFRMPGAVRLLAPSLRDKGFIAQAENGHAGLYYSTSRRTLWEGPSPVPNASSVFYTPKADGAWFAGPGRASLLRVRNRHPEVSLRALAGKVWYEGYEEPAYVWQSSSATDDFEPKLSLTPLMIGTLKGTLYSLLLAIPLGVLGAMYTSQFMHPRLKRYVKPTVEIMAALPSVVLGFLAGLWLAPRVERVFPSLVLMLVVLPMLVLVAGYLWQRLPMNVRSRVPAGSEALLFMVVLAAGMWLCLELNRPAEALLFGGDYREWLHAATGLRYDQRNAVVVGLAMGFAVIPIIFSIAEDAFSNVPLSLVSGSLALGANRWQTVTRIVLPTASPGIFSAIMIGFGRAVGETMIVLMATGNTPIMDWNPFNGFRTLSANIAVEIPEAPHGGTLYRTLFLAALILFVLTFVINTAAEIVRQRLRRRFAQL